MHYDFVLSLSDNLKPLGRTLPDPETGILYCDWTLSGVELWFCGRTLLVDLTALPGAEQERDPLTGQLNERLTWPWCAVILDDGEQPDRIFEVTQERQTQLLFHSEEEELHRIRLIKRTENGKGYLGLAGFWSEGKIVEAPKRLPKKQIVLIGDSITCGFGNDTRDRNRLFFAADEDGWMSYGAIAARLLDMEPTIISSSGICLTAYTGWPHPYAMDRLYDYTDRMREDRLGRAVLTQWDFAAHPVDYVVLNLGTNDVNGMALEGADGPRHQADAYRAFLEHLRAVHPKAYLICTLGSMDYYLYSDIESIVEEYVRGTGDCRITVFRYPKMDIADPVGACGHPHIMTHQKMGHALADFIAALERESTSDMKVQWY